jgi:hypothetical protein
MRIASATAAFLAVTCAAWSARADAILEDHACMGRWVGRGHNTGFPTEWTIDLTLTSAASGGRCGTIEYTNPLCGGTLEDCTLVAGEIRTRERYTHDEGHCAAPGRVILRCDGDQMKFRWIGWEQTDTVLYRPANGAAATATPSMPVVEAGSGPPSAMPSASASPSSSPKATRGCGSGCAIGSGGPPSPWALFLVIVLAGARRVGRRALARSSARSAPRRR